jgi:DNA polymerase III alpha subunit (gram-positive type)
LSTLTKVLIVLLTVFSIFLCGIVVTYVANADDQAEIASNLNRRLQAAERTADDAREDLQTAKEVNEAMKAELEEQINQLTMQVSQLQGNLTNLQRESAQLLQKVTSSASQAETAQALATQQTNLFTAAQEQVKTLEAETSNLETELEETNQMLLEKLSIIAQLQTRTRELTEMNQELETRLNQYLQQYGRMASRPQTVTPGAPAAARPAPPSRAQSRALGLDGRVTAVDMNSRLAEISIGTAAGVRQDMKFHVTRGDRFVADILVLEVWPDKAVGIIDLVQPGMQPQAGHTVTTNL